MQANRWQFLLPCGCGGTSQGTSPDRACPGLHLEPLDATWASAWRRIAPAAVMVDEFVKTTLNTNKTQLLPSNYGTFDL